MPKKERCWNTKLRDKVIYKIHTTWRKIKSKQGDSLKRSASEDESYLYGTVKELVEWNISPTCFLV